jgi:ATP-dependent RNA helicase RhlE
MKFEELKLHPHLLAAVQALAYTETTPIQQTAIPPILQGRDLMGIAQTGTGKTAAFVLPMLQHLMEKPGRGLRGLVLSPTRELAEQILAVIGQLAGKSRLAGASVYGGVNINTQIKTLRRGVDIVVACPGRLLDHIQRRTIDLSKIEKVVLDEADQMFDMGFLPDVRKIVQRLPKQRQTLMFSATMPVEIKALTAQLLKDPVHIQVDRFAPAATVSHTFFRATPASKNAMLNHLLLQTPNGSVLVFTRTKHRSKQLARKLEQRGHRVAALHGNLSQAQRQKALAGFRGGRVNILVATDVAARGIDVADISRVINYDIPATTEAYTHRIGRTGRACRAGAALTFVCEEDRHTELAIGRLLGERLMYEELEGFVFRAAATGCHKKERVRKIASARYPETQMVQD